MFEISCCLPEIRRSLRTTLCCYGKSNRSDGLTFSVKFCIISVRKDRHFVHGYVQNSNFYGRAYPTLSRALWCMIVSVHPWAKYGFRVGGRDNYRDTMEVVSYGRPAGTHSYSQKGRWAPSQGLYPCDWNHILLNVTGGKAQGDQNDVLLLEYASLGFYTLASSPVNQKLYIFHGLLWNVWYADNIRRFLTDNLKIGLVAIAPCSNAFLYIMYVFKVPFKSIWVWWICQTMYSCGKQIWF